MSEEQAAPATPEVEVPRGTLETPAAASDGTKPSESAPEAKVEETTVQDDNLPKPDKSQSKFDKRIAQLNRKIGEQQARADMLQRQLEEARPKPEVKTGLKLADFDYDEDRFAEAIAKETETTTLKRHSEEQQAQMHKQALERLSSEWAAKTAKADSKYDDFEEVVGELNPGNPVTIAIMQAENGEDIAYHLATNLKEARRIASLDPVSAIREIGRLEAKLLAEPLKAKEPSKAPAPIVPLNGKASSVDSMPSDSDDIKTWMSKERARQNKASA